MDYLNRIVITQINERNTNHEDPDHNRNWRADGRAACCVGPGRGQTQQRHQVQLNPAVNSKVPQAQKATVQKREQARQQRDKKLKVRAANVQSRGGQTSLQKPAHR